MKTFWSVQQKSFIEGDHPEVFYGCKYFIDHDGFVEAYSFMKESMEKKLNLDMDKLYQSLHSSKTPTWAWLKKPTKKMIRTWNGKETELENLIVVEFQSNEYLISDFEKYHFVLNNVFLPTSIEDMDIYDQETDAFETSVKLNTKDVNFRDQQLKSSWQQIFTSEEKSVSKHPTDFQAVVPYIKRENIKQFVSGIDFCRKS